MAPSITSEKITLKYPVYAADFLDSDRLVVAGGGGEGRSGVGNIITLLDVSKSSSKHSDTETEIKQLAELELSRQEDSCMSLAISRPVVSSTRSTDSFSGKPIGRGSTRSRKKKAAATATAVTTDACPMILAGVNSSEKSQLAGKNEHFRIFSISGSEIVAESRFQLFAPKTPSADSYQRVLRSCGGIAAVASGGGRTGSGSFEIVVAMASGGNSVDVKRRIKTDVEVSDLDLSKHDTTLVYCTDKEIFSTQAVTAEEPKKILSFLKTPGTIRTIRFVDATRLIAVFNRPQRTGSELLLINIITGTIITRRKLHKVIKAVTGLDTVDLRGQCAVAVAGADQSVEVLVVEGDKIKPAQTFHEVHPFQISKVTFSPTPPPPPSQTPDDDHDDQNHIIRLATTSIGNTVVVFTLPLLVSNNNGYRLLRSGTVARQTAISVLLSLFAVAVFAALLQVVFITRVGLSKDEWEQWVRRGVGDLLPKNSNNQEAFFAGMKAGGQAETFGDGGIDVESLLGNDVDEALSLNYDESMKEENEL